ncbi:MAG: hypothetical protein WAV38_31485 [Xanthobacteraceae bacterium]
MATALVASVAASRHFAAAQQLGRFFGVKRTSTRAGHTNGFMSTRPSRPICIRRADDPAAPHGVFAHRHLSTGGRDKIR